MKTFKLPDLGEGLVEAEIVEWLVKEGDVVALDQHIVSMETAKAVVEIPSPIAGRIVKLFGQSGDIIKTGDPLVEFEVSSAINEVKAAENEHAPTVAGRLQKTDQVWVEPMMGVHSASSHPNIKVTPAVRALAQRLSIDLSMVNPSGPNGTFTTQDVEQAAKLFKDIGGFEPLKGTRRTMSQVMSQSHREVVPVTVFEDVKLAQWSKMDDLTVKLIQAIAKAAANEPALNAWFDGKNSARREIKELNLGLAMDSDEGLFVPVIKSAEKMDAPALRQKIDDFKERLKTRQFTPEELRGTTFTLSNFGKFTGRYANPVIVLPTVAILGVGKLREEVVAINHQAVVCPVLPLALTFDHRAVTGGEATRFLKVVIETLESSAAPDKA